MVNKRTEGMGPSYDTELYAGKQPKVHNPKSCKMVQKGVWVIYVKFDTDYVTFNSLLKSFRILNVRENLSKRDHTECDSMEKAQI